ncbi:MAG: cyanophycin synthetase [Parcubacteria bacterium C7867-004]|nr:MAG: cyanophycin synthetase [Parcubacteria bacterium C7867-004]
MPFPPKPAPCAECGDGAIFHRTTYISIVIDEFLSPLTMPNPFLRGFAKLVYKIERKVTPHLLNAMMDRGMARRVTKHDDDTQLLAQMLWNEAKERGIEVAEFRLFNLPRNIFVAKYPNGRDIAYEGIPAPVADLDRVPWMDNKDVLKKKFRALGLPIARGGAVSNLKEAKKLFATLTPPVIAKPSSGSGSRHTTLHVMDEEGLERAFLIGKQVAPKVVIEEELVGPVYRATVVNGRFAAALRRDQPYVVGDGVHTVEDLVAIANEHPKRSGPYFHKMKLDETALEELRWQDLTPSSILPEGKRALLHQKINWSVGGTTADVTDDVHPDNIELFEEVARVLKAPIVGLDFIIEDISRSWKEQERCGILECNSMPFFDNHHLPFEGKPRNVAALIWDMNEE